MLNLRLDRSEDGPSFRSEWESCTSSKQSNRYGYPVGRSRGHLGTGPDDGALHAGHLSLVQRARAENMRVGVSIFVNPISSTGVMIWMPTAFARPGLRAVQAEGVDLVWRRRRRSSTRPAIKPM